MGPYHKPADNSAAASVPASSATSLSVDEPSSARSFFSRFSLPLRSRARNVADFHIRPAEPHRKYSAGDHVQGAVILTVVKPVRITHLTVSLHGYVRVYKGPNVPSSEPIVNPADVPTAGGRAARLKGASHGYAPLFQDEQVLSSDGRLEAGRYEFNFDLLFPPKGLPSSIDVCLLPPPLSSPLYFPPFDQADAAGSGDARISLVFAADSLMASSNGEPSRT